MERRSLHRRCCHGNCKAKHTHVSVVEERQRLGDVVQAEDAV